MNALLLLGEIREARAGSDALVEADPQDSRLLLLRGDVESAAGDPWEALRWYRAARSDPTVAGIYLAALQARYDEIDAALGAGDAARARELCGALISVAPEEIHAREVRAHTHAMEGRPELALRAFEEVLELEPRSLVALRALVNLSEALGDAGRARCYRQELLRVGGPGAFE